MRHELHTYLSGRPDGAGSQELLDLLFDGRGRDNEFGALFLERLLSEDPRFEFDSERRRWRAVDDHLFSQPLDSVPFVVVDLEATGNRIDEGGITEIGAVKVIGGAEVEAFEQLVNPGRAIPPYVSKLTGINDSLVADAPRIEEVIGKFRDFAKGSVLVAHNASFDSILLNRESSRLLGGPLGCPTLCTIDIANEMIPDLERTSLDALAVHFGLDMEARHRAMADARLTAQVLQRLLDIAKERGATSIDGVLAEGEPVARRRFVLNVAQAALEALPAAAGVYRLSDEQGDALYVGRAADLRAKLVELFSVTTHASARDIKMVSEVHGIDFVQAPSELEAFLEESRQIRDYDPSTNRGGKHLPRTFFVKLVCERSRAQICAASRLLADGSLYLGPVRNRALAEESARYLSAVFDIPLGEPAIGPRARAGSRRRRRDESAVDEGCLRRAGELRDAVSRGFDALQDEIRARDTSTKIPSALHRLGRLDKQLGWVASSHCYVAVVPSVGHSKFAALVIDGRFAGSTIVRTPPDVDELRSFVRRRLSQSEAGKPETVAEADANSILATWVRTRPPEPGARILWLDPGDVDGSLAGLGDALSLDG